MSKRDRKTSTCVFDSLPLFDGKAFRADYGPPYGRNTTAYDAVIYEEKELGNDNNVHRSILPELKKIPASGVVWVTKNKADARVYGKNIQEVYLEEGSRIIGEDGDGGYLVLRGKFIKKKLILQII
jgi:hypothetical protein